MHAASRATERLTHALMLVRAAAGQGPAGFPFFHGPWPCPRTVDTL
jgi:hypothetical protein